MSNSYYTPHNWSDGDTWNGDAVDTIENRLDAAFEDVEAVTMPQRIYNVDKAPYSAVSDVMFFDGVATSGSATFTSATANFQPSDTGKYIVILKAGASGAQDYHGTITYVNSTTVTLQSNAGRSQSSCRFYLTRGGDSGPAIQSAIDDAAAAGGGVVYLPGVGYYTGQGLVLKNRVTLRGAGVKSTFLHLGPSVNAPVVRNDQTLNNAGGLNTIEDIWIDGNRGRQTNPTTTLSAGYTAGASTLSVASATNFDLLPTTILIGSNYLEITAVSGTTCTIGGAGLYGSTDASALSGATVTILKCHGIMLTPNPTSAGGTIEEQYDPHHTLRRIHVKNCKAYGVAMWGQSTSTLDDVWVSYADYCNFRSSYDTFMSNCVSDQGGRIGFYFRGSSTNAVNCKSFYSGNTSATEGWGFLLEGPSSQEEGCRTLASCNAQDNKAEGYYLRLAQRVQIQGTASSNGTSSPGTYAAMKINGASLGTVDLVCTERVASPNNSQQNAIEILNTLATTTAMKIRLTHAAATGSAVGTAIKSGSTLTGGVDLSINGMGGTLAGTYAATYTPDPYQATNHLITLTGNITIAAPSNAHYGCPLNFVFLQDATGGRTITFNAVFKKSLTATTTANTRTSIGFIYDGTNWVQTGTALTGF